MSLGFLFDADANARGVRTGVCGKRGGVYVIPPAVVRDVGHGSLSAGEKVLDRFVQKVRNKAAQHQKLLPPPTT
jgi:hypothetical protein